MQRRASAYERWVREHADDLYRYAHRAVGDPAAAEDLVQETYYEAWKSMPTLRDPARARAWLFRIMRRRVARWRAGEARSRALAPAPIESAAGVASREQSPDGEASGRDALQHALDALDERLKTPLLMVFIEGLTCRETAARLDLPLGTVLSRVHRAKRRLREAMDDAGDDRAHTDARSTRLRLGGVE